MLTKTEGIVLRCYNYKDNKYLAHILTQEHGIVTYAVYAPQSKRSRTRMSYFQPLTLLEIDAEHKPNRTIQAIKELRPVSTGMNILSSPRKIALAMFVAEVTNACILPENPDAELYSSLRSVVESLDSDTPPDGHFALRFMISLSDYLGFNPTHDAERLVVNEFLNSAKEPDERELFLRLIEAQKSGEERVFTHTERQILLRAMLRYFKFNLPDMPQIHSAEVLEAVFE